MRAELPSPESIRQLPKDGGPNFNRLIFESSPYLLQHARNPIEWYPWSEEALEIARSENKPIFLSIGYTTCHWCHVMEKESFEDQEVAALLNQHYICIKVDREARPDLDHVYMSVTQMMTGRARWSRLDRLHGEDLDRARAFVHDVGGARNRARYQGEARVRGG